MRRVLGFFFLHTLVWTGLVLVLPGGDRVDYDLLGDASTPWVRQFVIALLVVLAIQIVFISREKMWSEVLRDRPRAGRFSMWLPPALVLLIGVSVLVDERISDAPIRYWIGMTATMLLVGITEEVTFRGILVVGARRRWGSEWRALLLSSVLFGLFHLPNWLLGQGLSTTIRQVIVTALMGGIFYSLRRASGTLLTCIVLHAAYDWVLIQGMFD